MHLRFRGAVLASLALACCSIGNEGFAQPGGMGGAGGPPPGGGRGGPPHEMKGGGPGGAMPAADPLKTFFEDMRSLRDVLVLRDDQTEAWIALREALREHATARPAGPGASRDDASPERAIRNLADEARRRADALQRIGDTLDTLRGSLDEHQRSLFDARLSSAFERR